jgi:hypothetical protein
MEADAHFQNLTIYFGVPNKGALPPGPLHRVPQRERDAPLLEPSFIHLSKSPVYEPTDSRFSLAVKVPLWRFPYPKPF